MNSLIEFLNNENGQGMVEYALILVFIALAVIVAVSVFGKSTANLYNDQELLSALS